MQTALLTTAMSGSTSLSEDKIYARLIRALVDARREAGHRQVDVARRLGRPQAFVSRYETLERRIDMGQFVGIAQAIGVDPVALLSEALRDQSEADA